MPLALPTALLSDGEVVNDPMAAAMENLKVCNCAECGKELVPFKYAAQLTSLAAITRVPAPRFVAGRIKGRPYCYICLHE
jgi:hypothetical protein